MLSHLKRMWMGEEKSGEVFWLWGLCGSLLPLMVPIILVRDWFAGIFIHALFPLYTSIFSFTYFFSCALLIKNFTHTKKKLDGIFADRINSRTIVAIVKTITDLTRSYQKEIVIEKIETADQLSEKIEGIGYKGLGDYTNQGSRLFIKERDGERLVNLHVFEARHPHVEEMIHLRNYFRSHPERVKEYSKLKFDLVEKYPNDYGLYRKYKDQWMNKLKETLK